MSSNWCFKESELIHIVDFYFTHQVELSSEQRNKFHKLLLDCCNIMLYFPRDQRTYLGYCQLFTELKNIVFSGSPTFV